MAVSARLTNPNTAQDTRFAMFLVFHLIQCPPPRPSSSEAVQKGARIAGDISSANGGVSSAFYDAMFKSNEMTKHLQGYCPMRGARSLLVELMKSRQRGVSGPTLRCFSSTTAYSFRCRFLASRVRRKGMHFVEPERIRLLVAVNVETGRCWNAIVSQIHPLAH